MKITKYLSVVSLCWLMSSCVEPVKTPVKTAPFTAENRGELVDYGDPALSAFKTKLAQSRDRKIHIFQLGDSHTAADLMSGALREHFQQQYGDGGVGFISPLAIPGNRYASVRFTRDSGWSVITSRKTSGQPFTLGGNIALPTRDGNQAAIQISDGQGPLQIQALYRANGDGQLTLQNVAHPLPSTQGEWRFSPVWRVASPVSFSLAPQGQAELAGWMLTRPGGGVLLSAAGINGAQISMLNKWQATWRDTLAQLQPDMVILAYGTNEAFNNDLDIAAYRALLTEQISALRNQLPESVIMLVGPGSSIMHKQASRCADREPANLSAVISTQRDVARQEHVLFWDWYGFMGGACSIDNWAARGLAKNDRVHLTPEGYQASADALWQQLSNLLRSE